MNPWKSFLPLQPRILEYSVPMKKHLVNPNCQNLEPTKRTVSISASEYLLIFCPIFYFMVIRQSTVLVFAIIFLAEVALILSNVGKVLQNPKTEGWSNYLFFLLSLTPFKNYHYGRSDGILKNLGGDKLIVELISSQFTRFKRWKRSLVSTMIFFPIYI